MNSFELLLCSMPEIDKTNVFEAIQCWHFRGMAVIRSRYVFFPFLVMISLLSEFSIMIPVSLAFFMAMVSSRYGVGLCPCFDSQNRYVVFCFSVFRLSFDDFEACRSFFVSVCLILGIS